MEDNIKKLFEVNPKKIPDTIPIFPLDNVLLLPFGKLPLNIFEERYLHMALESLKSNRMIGIIQPKNNNNELFSMGCIGKITSFIETGYDSPGELVLDLVEKWWILHVKYILNSNVHIIFYLKTKKLLVYKFFDFALS